MLGWLITEIISGVFHVTFHLLIPLSSNDHEASMSEEADGQVNEKGIKLKIRITSPFMDTRKKKENRITKSQRLIPN